MVWHVHVPAPVFHEAALARPRARLRRRPPPPRDLPRRSRHGQARVRRVMHASDVARHLLCGSVAEGPGCCSLTFPAKPPLKSELNQVFGNQGKKKRLFVVQAVLMMETCLNNPLILPTTSNLLTRHKRVRIWKRERKPPAALLEWTCLF